MINIMLQIIEKMRGLLKEKQAIAKWKRILLKSMKWDCCTGTILSGMTC